MSYLFPVTDWPGVPVKGEARRFPVHRIFCVGRNYAAHAAEMGMEVDREAPFYFTKSPLTAIASGSTIPYPPGTGNYHHEVELVVAIGAPVFNVDPQAASTAVFAYGCGLDMTRRDLQLESRRRQRPWDTGKDFEQSAVFAPLTRADEFGVANQRIHLEVNGKIRQDSALSDLIWSVEDIVADLSKLYHLQPGDLIMTGTPAGVGSVDPGDVITAGIDGLMPVTLNIRGNG